MLTKNRHFDCADVPSGSALQTLGPATVKALQAANQGHREFPF